MVSKESLQTVIIEGANHGLEIQDDVRASLRGVEMVIEAKEEFPTDDRQ